MMITNALFTIRVASQLTGLHAQTIRKYESKGLISPLRSSGGTRLYSQDDIDRLLEISQLSDAGVGIEGIARILDLEREVEELEQSIDALLSENAQLKSALMKNRRLAQTTAIVIRNTPLPPQKL